MPDDLDTILATMDSSPEGEDLKSALAMIDEVLADHPGDPDAMEAAVEIRNLLRETQPPTEHPGVNPGLTHYAEQENTSVTAHLSASLDDDGLEITIRGSSTEKYTSSGGIVGGLGLLTWEMTDPTVLSITVSSDGSALKPAREDLTGSGRGTVFFPRTTVLQSGAMTIDSRLRGRDERERSFRFGIHPDYPHEPNRVTDRREIELEYVVLP